jgi:hypothetical protein
MLQQRQNILAAAFYAAGHKIGQPLCAPDRADSAQRHGAGALLACSDQGHAVPMTACRQSAAQLCATLDRRVPYLMLLSVKPSVFPFSVSVRCLA